MLETVISGTSRKGYTPTVLAGIGAAKNAAPSEAELSRKANEDIKKGLGIDDASKEKKRKKALEQRSVLSDVLGV